MTMNNAMRAASIFAVLLAGSCAAPVNDSDAIYDPLQSHPITVEPSYEALKVSFSAANAGLLPEDESRFTDFVQNYAVHGNGAISVSVPEGPNSSDALHYFGDRIAAMGVLPSHILVGTHVAAGGDSRVEISYVSYVAHTDTCGQWPENAADTASNLPMHNFGCANQHNIAVMVADPRDLEQSRALGTADASKRGDTIEKYEKGKIITADKRKSDLPNEQSGSDFNP